MTAPDSAHINDMSMIRLNAVRIIIILIIALGYSSTMSPLTDNVEFLHALGYDPSWFGIQLVFAISGFLGLRSLERHGSSLNYLLSRLFRNWPLLIVYTLITVLIIYPIMCLTDESFAQEARKLALYFIKTVLCIDPGARLPGLLDDAKYMCLIQGAIWTFRWGVIAHIAMAVGWQFSILKSKHVIIALAILATVSYITLAWRDANHTHDAFGSLLVGLRLSYAFLGGAALWAWQDKLPRSPIWKIVLWFALMGSAITHYLFIPWSSAVTEVLGAAAWTYLAIVLIQTPWKMTAWMNNWPNYALALYIGNWPICQVLVYSFPNLNGWPLVAASLTLTSLTAIISHRLISRPINIWSAQFLRRKIAV